MQIIQTPPPRLDAQNTEINFANIRQYLQNTMETIDFVLAKYAGALKSVDADGVEQKLKEFQSQVVSLERAVTDLKNRQNETKNSISELSNTIAQINGSLTGINHTLADHQRRIEALENAGGGS